MIEIVLLFIPMITTVTSGLAMYSDRASVTTSFSSSEVSPSACTSSSRGTETIPSLRTTSRLLSSGFFQTVIISWSVTPIT